MVEVVFCLLTFTGVLWNMAPTHTHKIKKCNCPAPNKQKNKVNGSCSLVSTHISACMQTHMDTHTYINIQKNKRKNTTTEKMGREEEEGIGQWRSEWERGQGSVWNHWLP